MRIERQSFVKVVALSMIAVACAEPGAVTRWPALEALGVEGAYDAVSCDGALHLPCMYQYVSPTSGSYWLDEATITFSADGTARCRFAVHNPNYTNVPSVTDTVVAYSIVGDSVRFPDWVFPGYLATTGVGYRQIVAQQMPLRTPTDWTGPPSFRTVSALLSGSYRLVTFKRRS